MVGKSKFSKYFSTFIFFLWRLTFALQWRAVPGINNNKDNVVATFSKDQGWRLSGHRESNMISVQG